MEAEVFRPAHDFTHHGGFVRTYDRLRHSIYVQSIRYFRSLLLMKTRDGSRPRLDFQYHFRSLETRRR